MKLRHLILILGISLTLPGIAETVDELRTRLVTTDVVKAAGDPVVAGAGVTCLTATGNRILTEVNLPVVITTDAAGAQRMTKILLLVYDYNDPSSEEAYLVDANVSNYTAPAEQTAFEAAKIAVDAALGAGNWKFIGIETGQTGTIATIRRTDTNAKLAVTLAADGTPITVEAE